MSSQEHGNAGHQRIAPRIVLAWCRCGLQFQGKTKRAALAVRDNHVRVALKPGGADCDVRAVESGEGGKAPSDASGTVKGA